MFEVVLINPEIPQNTGNIARTVLSQKCRLHLVKPYGFRLDTAAVKRAGVDYWKFVEITEWESKEDFFAANDTSKMHFFSQKGVVRYDKVAYKNGDFLVFGCESAGLGDEILGKYASQTRFLPMLDGRVRSLNLASAATSVIFEAMKQNNFSE
jgi:Predicted rRNA methylase (SpoU class)